MNPKNQELLTRIEGFSFDEAGTSFTFAQRLARENGWSAEYTRSALREYRRFIFLAMTSAKAVCPSEAVDQVWHQHLTFTQNYWEDFCGTVLGKPLHHGPTRGGHREAEKHHDMYERTLAQYREAFGEEPPADVWEPSAIRFGEGDSYVRVNRRRAWIIRKPAWLRQAAMWSASGLPWLAVRESADYSGNIFDWNGREFLSFYFVAIALTFMVAIVMRAVGRRPLGRSTEADVPTDPYVTATLAGGSNLAVSAAVASLAHRQLIAVTGSESISRVAGASAPADLHPFEQAVFQAISGPLISLKELRAAVAIETGAMRRLLDDQELVLTEKRQRALAGRVTWLFLMLMALGGIKLVVGLFRSRPVLYLVLILLVLGIALLFFRRVPYRTQLGDSALRRLRNKYRRTEIRDQAFTFGDSPNPAAASDAAYGTMSLIPMAVGLYGLHALYDTPLRDLEHNLVPPGESATPGGSSGCTSTFSSGCNTSDGGSASSGGGSSGCSSGSSDGGSSGCSSGSSGCGGCGGGGGGD